MLIILSAIAAVLPMSLYLFFIWRFDRYDREPVSTILRNYLWGALGAVIFSILGSDVLSFIVSFFVSNHATLTNIQTIFIAPIVEETTKGMFLLLTIANRKFDNLTDGIVYGAAIGLGFGMTENFLYFISFGDTLSNWIMLVVIRTLFSGVMHGVSTATLGAFLGYAKFRNFSFKLYAGFLGLASAMFIHFMWNLTVSFQSTATLGFIFLGITVLIMVTVFSFSVSQERRIILSELSEEVDKGLIPADHLYILNSKFRNNFGWIDENIRKLYVVAATNLAFRKMQYRNSIGNNKTFCEQEILYYRNYIQDLLSNNRTDQI